MKRQATTALRALTGFPGWDLTGERVPACPTAVLIKPQGTDIISSDLLISHLFSYL